jgi:hypothetical protein
MKSRLRPVDVAVLALPLLGSCVSHGHGHHGSVEADVLFVAVYVTARVCLELAAACFCWGRR